MVTHRKPQGVVVDLEFLGNMGISWEAKGLYAYLDSLSDEEHPTTIRSTLSKIKHNIGHKKLRRMLSELEDIGLLEIR